jgi:fibro-slime domain-containing protein
MKKTDLFLLLAFCFYVSNTNAQIVQDTIWVPVTYYDFRSDKSNPEFECPNEGKVRTGMVADTLDAEGKPQLGKIPYRNYYIKYWFRSWKDSVPSPRIHGQGDYTVPIYTVTSWINGGLGDQAIISYDGIDTVNYDTAFKSIVIHDTLPFVRLQDGTGRYQYDNQNFFPIDNRGFRNEGKGHNYSFTMQLDWKFQKKTGQTFEFSGDDDVWAFVNSKLVMDLGGLHGTEYGNFSMSDLSVIKDNAICTLSVFYAERHSTSSDIKITTNIIYLPIDSLQIKVKPDSSICAGDTLLVTASFKSDTGEVKQIPPRSTLTWHLISSLNSDTTLKIRDSISSRFIPTEAYDTAKIWGEYYNPDENIRLKDTVTIYISACHADHMVIEASDDSLVSLRNDNPLGTIKIGANQQSNSGMYAILRDKYGNWVKPADSSAWTSANTLAITVTGGPNLLRGQGTVHRGPADTGKSVVTATYNENGNVFNADVVAIANNITYTKIRLVVINGGQAVPVDSVSIRTKEDTTLVVQGLRSDDGKTWERATALWNPVSGVTLDRGVPPDSSESFTFIPKSTGRATVSVTKVNPAGGQPLTANVILIVTHGDPDHMLLYDTAGTPSAKTLLPDTISIVAGTSKKVDAKLFDNNDEWLEEFEKVDSLSNRISWTLSDNVNAGISSSKGHEVNFTSTVTDTFILTAHYVAGNISLHKPLVIVVRPGQVKMLVIEPNKDGKTLSPHKPQIFQDSTIVITSEQTSQIAYAVLRDIYGNWVGYSRNTEWKVDKPVIASLTKLNEIYGEVFINRIDSGLTIIHARDLDSSVEGTEKLHILNYYYKALQVAIKQKIGGNDSLVHIDSLVIRSDMDSLLYVRGLRSDTARWEQVTASWYISNSLSAILNPAPDQGYYDVAPKDTGSGWIRVSKGNDTKTEPDSVYVKFTQPYTASAKIEIIAPLANNRIAGDTMIAVVKIFDSRGKLIPGTKCFRKAVYQDTLGSKGRFEPVVIVDSVSDTINQLLSITHSIDQCFNGGTDTIKIVLYNAPVARDSVHKIFVRLIDSIPLPVAYTDPFNLKPGKIDSLDIQYSDGSSVGDDTVEMSVPDEKMFYTAGFDRYGNRIPGWTASNWSTSGGLPVMDVNNKGQILFETVSVTENKSGNLTAAAADSSAPLYVKDNVFIKILGPAIKLVKAITRDENGNGYLDHIELHFALPVSLPVNFSFSGVKISYDKTNFTVTGIENNTKGSDTVWLLILKEEENNIPQTAWKPSVSFDRNEKYSLAGAVNIECQDGAGPVVWKVEKNVGDANDHSKDIVTVHLSEPVMRSNGSLDHNVMPSVIFYVWEKDTNGQFIRVDSILAGINGLSQVPKDSIVSFTMSNKKDITARHYMNINTDEKYIIDKAQSNYPNVNNQKVRVNVIPGSVTAVIFPNPARADGSRVFPGNIYLQHDAGARQYLKTGGGGTILTFDIFVPPIETGVKTRCYLKVFDAVGNLVIQKKNDNILESLPSDILKGKSTSFSVDIYWNGFTAQKSKAAPGVYMTVLYIEYWGSPAAKGYNDQIRKGGKYPLTCMAGIER